MIYLPGKFLNAIFRVRSGPCFNAHAQVNCFDFSISSKVNMFSTFSNFKQFRNQSSKTEVVIDIWSNSSVQNAQWVRGLWVATI